MDLEIKKDLSCNWFKLLQEALCNDISILEILEMKNNVAIYPNPTKNFIDVKLGSSFRYQTFNNAGQLILSGDSEGRIDFSNLSAGTYQLLIYTDSDIFSRTIEKL